MLSTDAILQQLGSDSIELTPELFADAAKNLDSRKVVVLDAHARAELLGEMRGHLVSLHALLDALAKNDLKRAGAAARASGAKSAPKK